MGLPISKQLQIEQFVKENNVDILHLQEVNIESDTFSECNTISSSFNIISNNSQSKYGRASLVRNEVEVKNIAMDNEGRIIIFEVGDLTCGNMYIHSGTDANSRSQRENYFAEVVPRLLINHRDNGFIGGDLNCIIEKEDATNNPETKISPSLKRLVKTFRWSDSFRLLHPSSKIFSRYYSTDRYEGASRIDRCYSGISVLRTTRKEAITRQEISFKFSNFYLVVGDDHKNCPQLLFFS